MSTTPVYIFKLQYLAKLKDTLKKLLASLHCQNNELTKDVFECTTAYKCVSIASYTDISESERVYFF